MSFDHNPSGTKLASKFSDFFKNEVDFRIVVGFYVLAVDLFGDFFVQLAAVWKKVNDDGVGQDFFCTANFTGLGSDKLF